MIKRREWEFYCLNGRKVSFFRSIRRGTECAMFGYRDQFATYLSLLYTCPIGRVAPAQGDTIRNLEAVLSIVPQGDCVCILGDLNEQLESCVKNRTGKWTAGPKSPNSDKIIELM